MKQHNKPTRSIDIPLPERVPLSGDAFFVRLPTLAALERCWAEQRESRPFSAEGVGLTTGQNFLNSYEWIFAPTKAALVAALTRWEAVGIGIRWYDWKGDSNTTYTYEEHFRDYEERREKRIAEGIWTLQDEVDHLEYSPERYTGEWVLDNLPNEESMDSWFDLGFRSLIDRSMPAGEIIRIMQERTFDHWEERELFDVRLHDREGMDKEIEYWQQERLAGEDYYGKENE
ncbi:hypothetical protein [Lysobacter enzymogenes]|uniref:hypothetical protein n=1 Tax=Lysobacter enzymogenes TaxID=69 RepID=UPI001AF1C69D|nr:hypothetical protein [Lysobacter enzymogenes]QQQ01011.1 hypothetical protein JHW41_23575 [Lysobacter enzymogenes]